ncbi:sensor histidine kinase [Nocardia sp. NPDC020380]|uniref:sensor histidine kinase n=1 Tax=Nocardia sp. NPDC020380 TaxID=3364309 RepID=UPI0037A0A25C
MSRPVFALCVIPAGLGAFVELVSSNSLPQVGVDLVGAAIGTSVCVQAARGWPAPISRDGRFAAGLAAVILVIAAVSLVSSSYTPWAAASVWLMVVATGVAASRIVSPVDAVITAIPVVAALGSTLSLMPRGHEDPTVTLALTIPLVTALGVGLLTRSHRQRLVAERGAAVADERAQMARELHDVIAHEVMGIVVLAQAAGPGADERTRPLLARIEGSGRRALDDIRALVGTLNENAAAARDTRDLTDLVSRFSETIAAQVIADIDPAVGPPRISSPVQLATHRILLEAFNNIRRHAGDATRVEVAVRLDAGSVTILVCDNGSGESGLGVGGGAGLTGLAARADAVGGTLTAGRLPDGRWQLAATLPATETAGRT